MRRRVFIAGLACIVVSLPLRTRAQHAEQVRRIGVLLPFASDDPEAISRVTAFKNARQDLGWTVGKNLHIDYGWAGRDAERFPSRAAEMVGLSPDVIVANGSDAMRALQQSTRTLPIVFLAVVDPVGAGYVASLGRPKGNATGVTLFEYSIAGKWLELLKQIAPRVTRAAVLRDARLASGIGQFATIQTAAQSFGLEVDPIDVRDPSEIERSLAVFARGSDLGLLVTTSALAVTTGKSFASHQICPLSEGQKACRERVNGTR